MKITIFSECKKSAGLGHLARCFKLALIFLNNGYKVSFFIRGDGDYKSFLEQNKFLVESKEFFPLGVEWLDLKDKDLARDIAIIDSYEIEDFSFFINNYNCVLVLDDSAKFQHLLQFKNIFILSQSQIYKNISSEKVFCGAEFFPVLNIDEGQKIPQDIDYLICFGGEDHQDFSKKAYDIFKNLNFKVLIILGPNYRGQLKKDELKQEKLKGDSLISIASKLNLLEMQQALINSKNCIISGGGLLLESLNAIKNIVVLQTAPNQKDQIQAFSKNINIIDDIEKISDIKSLFKNTNSLIKKIGLGCEQIISSLSINFINSKADLKVFPSYHLLNLEAIDFCNLKNDEALLIFKCRNHDEVRKNMYGNEIISLKSHFKFLQSLKKNPTSKYFLIKYCNVYIGVISLSQINIRHKKAYLGIYKNPFLKPQTIKGHSLGSLLIDMLKHIAFNEYGLNMIYLEVTSTNIKAIRFYEKEHFKFIGELPYGFREQNGNFIDVLIYGLKNENYIF